MLINYGEAWFQRQCLAQRSALERIETFKLVIAIVGPSPGG
jgi:hypothetical protein